LIGVPVCAQIGEKVSISRKIENKWRYSTKKFVLILFRLIGWGTLEKGKPIGKSK